MGEERVGNCGGLALNIVLLLLDGVNGGCEDRLSGAGTRVREEYVGREGGDTRSGW